MGTAAKFTFAASTLVAACITTGATSSTDGPSLAETRGDREHPLGWMKIFSCFLHPPPDLGRRMAQDVLSLLLHICILGKKINLIKDNHVVIYFPSHTVDVIWKKARKQGKFFC